MADDLEGGAVKLDVGQKHLLRLVAKDTKTDGWAPVSAPVYPLMERTIPRVLIELEPVGNEGRGRVRLTAKGQSIIDAMVWL